MKQINSKIKQVSQLRTSESTLLYFHIELNEETKITINGGYSNRRKESIEPDQAVPVKNKVYPGTEGFWGCSFCWKGGRGLVRDRGRREEANSNGERGNQEGGRFV